MKKLFILFIGFGLFSTNINAQCTPDATRTNPGYYTSAGEGKMPDAEIDKAYNETITIVMFDKLLGQTVDSVQLLSVENIPTGLTYAALSNTVLGGSSGCIQVSGTPTNKSEVGNITINLKINIFINGSSSGVPRTETINLKLNDKPSTPSSIKSITSSPFAAYNAPNPFYPTTTFTIKNVVSKRVSLEVFNMLGKKVFSDDQIVLDNKDSFVFDASALPGGLYIYQLSDGKNTKVDRLLIDKH